LARLSSGTRAGHCSRRVDLARRICGVGRRPG
jgi:hypothetical protein